MLAYSTVSQLGYMFLACGVGAFTAGIFHLATHAFFKALLFLGAGSVIHALSGEQDLRKMGGLKGRIPVTFVTMFVAALAIAGIPGLSGFFSKDEILWKAFSSPAGGPVLWVVAAATAGITAFYMFRLVFLAFFGASRMDPGVEKHVHESPWTMTLPLSVLAVLSVVGGWIGIPAVLGDAVGVPNLLERWLAPPAAGAAPHHSAGLEIGLMALSVGIALCGIWLAHRLYRVRPETPGEIAKRWPALYDAVRNKYYVDEFYEWAVVRRVVRGADWLWQMFDARFIDGIVNGVADLVRAAGAGSGGSRAGSSAGTPSPCWRARSSSSATSFTGARDDDRQLPSRPAPAFRPHRPAAGRGGGDPLPAQGEARGHPQRRVPRRAGGVPRFPAGGGAVRPRDGVDAALRERRPGSRGTGSATSWGWTASPSGS